MRIILTKNGKIVINQFEKENNNSLKIMRLFKGTTLSPKFRMPSNKNLFKYKLSKSNNSGRIKYISSQKIIMNDYFNRDESKINERELELAKKIDISKPKVKISQKYLDKYQDSDNIYKEKLINLTNLLKPKKEKEINNSNQKNNMSIDPYQYKESKLKENINSDLRDLNKNIRIGDIISKSNKIKLKSYLVKEYKGHNDIRMPLDNNNKDSFNFRTKYENKDAINKNLNNILKSSIKSDKTSLIKYLKNAKSFSPYLRKLINCDNSQIFKLNQICGRLLNKTKSKSFSETKPIKNAKYKTIEKSNSFNILVPLLDKTNKILNSYSEYQELQTQRKKNINKKILKNIKKKYWNKLHLGKMSSENSNGIDDSINDYYIYIYHKSKK